MPSVSQATYSPSSRSSFRICSGVITNVDHVRDLPSISDRVVLGPEPTTVESAINGLLEAAIARVKDATSGIEAAQIEMICRGLAVFRPLVPVSVLANVSGAPEGAVRSLAVDLGRPLLLKGASVHFLDEPTETWFRERFRPNTSQLATFVERLRRLTASDAYAAAALPELLLELGKIDELVQLALSDEGLPSRNPLEERDVKLQRLRFALKACIQHGKLVAAAKLALKAGGETAGEQRQNSAIKNHTDIAGVLMAPDRMAVLVARRTFGDSWLGSHYAYDAVLLSGREEHFAEAKSRLRMAKDWLRAYFRLPQQERAHDEHLSNEDIAELVIATLRLEGAEAAAGFLKGWKPRNFVLDVGRLVGRRLLDLGHYDKLNAFTQATRDPWLTLGLCIEANAVGHLLPAPPLAALMRLLQRPGIKIPDPGWNESWRVLDAVRSAIEQALRALPPQTEVWAETLRRYLPAVPLESMSLRYGKDRACLWRAYALEAALCAKQLTADEIAPTALKNTRTRGGATYEAQLFFAEAGALLPWLSISAQIACGHPPSDLSSAVQDALNKSVEAERFVYQEQKAVRPHVAVEWLRILRSVPDATTEQVNALGSWVLNEESRVPVDTVIDLCRVAARRQGFERLAMDLSSDAYSTLDATRENAESRADSLLRLARAILTVSQDEARSYFNHAVDIADRIGDENLDRWVALLDLAAVAAEPGTPRPRTAYQLARIAELTYEYVERDKHFPWHSTVEALTDLCASSAFAILSRWRDRRFGDSERLLPIVVNRLVDTKRLPERLPIALAGITAWWKRADDLKRALSTQSSPLIQKTLAKVAYRFIRLSPLKSDSWAPKATETWAALKQLREQYGLDFPDLDRLSDRNTKDNDAPAVATQKSAQDLERSAPDWIAIFGASDLNDSASLRSCAGRLREYGPPFTKVAFFREGFARLKPGQEAAFVRAIATWSDFDFYDLRDLLQGLPLPVPNQLALREALKEAVLSVCRREPLRSQRRGWWDEAPVEILRASGLLTYGEIAAAALQGIAAQVDQLNASELFQTIGPLSLVLSAGHADEVLDFGFSLLELKPEDGDGEWREELAPVGNLVDAVAGYIWAGLASPEASERWQQAHVVKAIVELDYSDLLGAVIAKSSSDCGAFADQSLMFYSWHARQWLLVGLARGALENPVALRPAHVFLRESVKAKHVLVRELAAQALRTLRSAGEVKADFVSDLDLAVNRPTDVQLYSGVAEEVGASRKVEGEEKYHFEPDIGPYWLPPLGRAFGLNRRSIERRVMTAIRQELGWTGSFAWREDARLARKIFDDGEPSHSHGALPRTDRIMTYVAYHAMMIVAAELLGEYPVRREKGADRDEFENWISRYMLTRKDGRWVADRRSPKLVPKIDTYQQNWRWNVSANYLDTQLSTDDGLTVLYGDWHNGGTDTYENISVRSALVSTVGARSLLAALQTAPKFDRHALPYAADPSHSGDEDNEEFRDWTEDDGESAGDNVEEPNEPADGDVMMSDTELEEYGGVKANVGDADDDDIDLGPLKLAGWVSDMSKEARLDRFDPWGAGIPFRGPVPSADVIAKLELEEKMDGTYWQTRHGGMLRSELWASCERSGRSEETVSGERLSANAQFIRDLLTAFPDRTLILSVEVRRHPSRHERDLESLGSYPQPYIRYYLMGADGVASPL